MKNAISKYRFFSKEALWSQSACKEADQMAERAYRRGVSQTLAMLCEYVDRGVISLDRDTIYRLHLQAEDIRYSRKKFPGLLHQLLEINIDEGENE